MTETGSMRREIQIKDRDSFVIIRSGFRMVVASTSTASYFAIDVREVDPHFKMPLI